MWMIIELISKNPEISVSSRNNPEQFRISPHRPNVILGIENHVKKGLFP